jgi:[acyl-carrier-protein] S-malonyltransferase
MAKSVLLFPGQGSQFAGMGKSLCSTYPEAKAVFDEADSVLGFALSKLCFEGPEEGLKKTENTQPALLTVSVAAWKVLESRVPKPDYVAGHSLGEYSALVAAGSLKFADAVRLVKQRGRYMQEAVPQGVGAMAAVVRLPDGKLPGILAAAAQGEVVSAANFNSPEQTVIAGHAGAVNRAVEACKAAGAKRAILLPVSAPFHCSLMKPAQERMAVELAATEFADLGIPLVNNVWAREVRTGAEARQGLIEQIPGTVRWTESLAFLAAQGVKKAYEAGAGKVLVGLLRGTGIEGQSFGEASDMEKISAPVTA